MIPAAFEYHRPDSLDAALRLLTRLPEAKLLAGGHSLLPMMKLRVLAPPHLIDLGRLRELHGIREEPGRLVLGALTTHWEIESSVRLRRTVPLLAETAASVGFSSSPSRPYTARTLPSGSKATTLRMPTSAT